ncbi:Sec63 [Aspergillus nanangensis]|uniref:Sec63 n=1 Tax=Aspergillus nanangensis TaxID=2582783 RepID=A0AAD4CGF5_ASPNN|nr:Sec63 [Aspergillus nanangensis]
MASANLRDRELDTISLNFLQVDMGRKALPSFAMRRPPLLPRRMVDTQPASSRYTVSSGIDEKLVEGAQVSPFFSKTSIPDHGTQSNRQDVDEDLQLDAFDFELLAQSNRTMNIPRTSSYKPLHRDSSQQVPSFFRGIFAVVTGNPPATINHGSSSIDPVSSSSPLARFQMSRDVLLRVDDATHNRTLQNCSYQMQDNENSSSRSIQEVPEISPPNTKTPFQNIPMSIRGIVLVSTHELPDNYRSLFHFPVFNAIQSKCFQSVYRTDDNIVLAAPTGSGKTAIMELAICRLLYNLKDERFKVIYQAPTKSLCSERFRDWNRKFQTFGLQCAELTGDTDYTQLRSVQNSQIIITTPEKWDSMTRKWRDHARLMQLVKLFLIDEVHILKEARGATLEAVVSRMKSIGSNVRFVALSATIPNSEDIATWLGKNSTNQHVPALREHFGEEFRPVKLQRFVHGFQSYANDFAFDKMCTSK